MTERLVPYKEDTLLRKSVVGYQKQDSMRKPEQEQFGRYAGWKPRRFGLVIPRVGSRSVAIFLAWRSP